MAVAERREIQAIAALLSVNAFLGISDKTTKFLFPDFGQEVFDLVRFYLLTIVVFGLVVVWLAVNHNIPSLPKIPSIWAVVLNFAIFLIPSYLLIVYFFRGDSYVPLFGIKSLIGQGIIASDENLLAFILLPTIFPLGTGVGSILRKPVTLLQIKDYSLNFNPPDLNRFKYGLYAISLITLLHVGAYSAQVATFNEFYAALLVAFVMFNVLWWIKETFGFGACVATHTSWNLALIALRGSII